jgi:hypothetical protein
MANNGEPKMLGVDNRSSTLKMQCFSANSEFYPRPSPDAATRGLITNRSFELSPRNHCGRSIIQSAKRGKERPYSDAQSTLFRSKMLRRLSEAVRSQSAKTETQQDLFAAMRAIHACCLAQIAEIIGRAIMKSFRGD